CERLREIRLAGTGGADHEDVRLRDLHVVVALLLRLRLVALVVVVDGDGEGALRGILTDDVLAQEVIDLAGLGKRPLLGLLRRGAELLLDDLVAQPDALIADVDAGTGDQLPDLLLRLPAEIAL